MLAIELARKHLGKGRMTCSARICLTDAEKLLAKGQAEAAARRATRSVAYSVGILHPDYRRLTEATS
jgi:hypothetical protein